MCPKKEDKFWLNSTWFILVESLKAFRFTGCPFKFDTLFIFVCGEILLALALPLSVEILLAKGKKAIITNIVAINTPIITLFLFIMI
ncbi:MAG: hypothetical protein AMDU4_FER2C00071G0002 [Ferroplasma sp. Type II]|nr:MAG: hypothetical protein AMDU4_FER2C00071G0002 [Ferroplasma sp. Type II]